jgi:hypothetical protein
MTIDLVIFCCFALALGAALVLAVEHVALSPVARAKRVRQRRMRARITDLMLLGMSEYSAEQVAHGELHDEAKRAMVEQQAAMREIGI